MGFFAAIANGYRNYFGFSGRASRSEFWFFYLYNFLAVIGLIVIAGLFSLHGGPPVRRAMPIPSIVGLVLAGLLLVANALPMLALAVRRIHDTGQSGWWVLTMFIPQLGALAMIGWGCAPGTDGDNVHGPSPLALSRAGGSAA